MKVKVSVGNGGRGKYHTKERCRNLPDETKEIPKKQAERRGMDKCKFCAGTAEQRHGGTKPLRRMLEDGDIDYE